MPMVDKDWTIKRLSYINALNERITKLDSGRVIECKKAIQQAYDASSTIRHMANLHKEKHIQKLRFRSIGIRKIIKLEEFNNPTYYWQAYFSDVGRAIANGERKYLHERIGRRVTGIEKAISRSNPNFQILNEHIRYLSQKSLNPNVLLAPISTFVDFVQFYGSHLDFSHGRPEILTIEDCQLKVFWSRKYARLNSFVIFNSEAGIWNIILDQKTELPITIALGISKHRPGCVEYWVETLVRYQIINHHAFSRINLSR